MTYKLNETLNLNLTFILYFSGQHFAYLSLLSSKAAQLRLILFLTVRADTTLDQRVLSFLSITLYPRTFREELGLNLCRLDPQLTALIPRPWLQQEH